LESVRGDPAGVFLLLKTRRHLVEFPDGRIRWFEGPTADFLTPESPVHFWLRKERIQDTSLATGGDSATTRVGGPLPV